jgi:hypothetical protein
MPTFRFQFEQKKLPIFVRLNLEGKGRIVADRFADVVATKVDLAETANA